jgi:hypothetical protein
LKFVNQPSLLPPKHSNQAVLFSGRRLDTINLLKQFSLLDLLALNQVALAACHQLQQGQAFIAKLSAIIAK